MPRKLEFTPALTALIAEQDGVVAVPQLLAHGIGRSPVTHRTQQGRWRWLLPSVVLTQSGYPTVRQRLVAAWLWAGPRSAIDADSALFWYGVTDRPPRHVYVVVPEDSPARSQAFVVVRRSCGQIPVGARSLVPYVDPATALIVAARNAESERSAIAVLSRGLQIGLVSPSALYRAREAIGDKWCARADAALLAVGVGVRSPAERDARELILSSRIVPEPRWNQWVDLGDGGSAVCLDALWDEIGLVHETNGKRYHAWDLGFDDMQARHDRLTTAGLLLLHNTPVRIRRDGGNVLREIERTYARYRDRRLPVNVRLVAPPKPPIAAQSA